MSDLNFERKDLLNVTACCQKVLPLVYDDSLSYYEVLCKVQHKLNELIEINNTIRDEIHKEYVKILQAAKTVTDTVVTVTDARDEVLTLKQATEQYAHDVVTVYNETVQAKDTAVESAKSASQSASTATEKANSASTSATTASQKAQEATTGAQTATQKASDAQASADVAQSMSDIATAKADVAKDNADKVITAMSLVAGMVNLYQGRDITINVSSSDAETIKATVTPTIRNNVLYMNTLITQVINGVRNVKLPNIVTINLNMQNVFTWMSSKLTNVNRTNLPIVTYGGSRKISLNSVVLDTFNSSASGRSTGSWNYPIQLQVFSNNTDVINIESGKSETLYYNVTIAQPLTFQNEETPTPTDYIAKLNEETQARKQGDTQLQNNIDTLSNDTFHKNNIIPIANGGTGASDAYQALKNLNTTYVAQTETTPTEGVNGAFYISINNVLATIYNKTDDITFTMPANEEQYFTFETYDCNNAQLNFARADIGRDKYNNFIGVECINGLLIFSIYKGVTTEPHEKKIFVNNMNFTMIKN